MKINVLPHSLSFEANSEDTILQTLKKNNLSIKSSCGGCASCGTCVVKIISGEDHITPMESSEITLLGNIFHLTKERLACQTKMTGDIVIDISEHNEYIKNHQDLHLKVKKQSVLKKSKDIPERKASSFRSERKERPVKKLKEGKAKPKKFDFNNDDDNSN
jgi:ferredoxin